MCIFCFLCAAGALAYCAYVACRMFTEQSRDLEEQLAVAEENNAMMLAELEEERQKSSEQKARLNAELREVRADLVLIRRQSIEDLGARPAT